MNLATAHGTDLAIEEDPAPRVRLENLRKLAACFQVKAELARAIAANASQLSQLFREPGSRYWRPVPFKLLRVAEAHLGLPHLCMEVEGGIDPHLETAVRRCAEQGFKVMLPNTSQPLAQLRPAQPRQRSAQAPVGRPGLKALHAAALESFEQALRSGQVSDQQCLALMQQWLTQDTAAG